MTGGPTWFSLVNPMYINGEQVLPPLNASGKTFLEHMGYETWQDFADAVGDRETVADFAGDVVITAYNVRTGLSRERSDPILTDRGGDGYTVEAAAR